MRRRDYVVATVLAILPGTVAWVFIGATGRALLGGGGAVTWTLFVGGLIATVVLSILLGRLAKKRLGIDTRRDS